MFSEETLRHITTEANSELCDIMTKYGSDKAIGPHNNHHNYTKLYNRLFSGRRMDTLNVLEIGIGTVNRQIPSSMFGTRDYAPGASIRGWAEYFPNSQIYACDIDRDILFFENPRITAFYLNQTDESNIVEVCSTGVLKDVKFDIIIDDGLHHFPTNAQVMKHLLPKLNKGGVYIVEDVITSQYSPHLLPVEQLRDTVHEFVTLPSPFNSYDNNLFIVQKFSGYKHTICC